MLDRLVCVRPILKTRQTSLCGFGLGLDYKNCNCHTPYTPGFSHSLIQALHCSKKHNLGREINKI